MPLHVVTPLVESAPLGRALKAPVWVKLESLQPTGSFKLRGIGRACEEAKAGGYAELVSSSGGNAGLAVAWAGRTLGLPVRVFVPRTTSERMAGKMRDEGAVVHIHGDAWDDAHEKALEAAAASRAFYVHPFDAPSVWSGNGTVIEEAIAQGMPKPAAVVVAVGGGGLLCGVVSAMRSAAWSDVPVVAVETHGTASLHAAMKAGRPVDIGRIDSIAVTLGARRVCEQALDWTRKHPIVSWLCSDRQALSACLRFADDHRVVVEPACGAALAAIYDRATALPSAGPVLVIACGGAGANVSDLARWDVSVAQV